MRLAFTRSPRVAFVAAALTGLVWLNQGPSSQRYDALTSTRAAERGVALRAWLPLAFAYRRAVDEELYYATANAIRGLPFDRAMLAARRGSVPEDFRRLPPSDGRWHVPYTEVPFEYPALVLPFVLLPAFVSPTFEVFAIVSGALMAALILASIAIALRARETPDPDRAVAWWIGAALLVAQGGLAIQRVDAVPTAFLAVALWAGARRKASAMGLGVGLAAASKVTPIFALLPMMAADREAWRTPAALRRMAGGVVAGLSAGFVPMLLASPEAIASFFGYHGARGLQIESTYGTVAALAQLMAGHGTGAMRATLSFGSYNVDGDASRWWAAASTPILALSVLLWSAWIARRPAPATQDERAGAIACAGLGALLCVWLFGKVFSPQYMTWAIPFAATIPARRVAGALVAAMAIAQTYLRGFYDHVVDMRPDGVLALVARLAALVLLAIYVVRAFPLARPQRPPDESLP
jgi:hypothetical protein